ncbi:unnamed protein product, partial [Mesorhabditis belari]|uniref:Uncharacterized protein n=1 Tax=Mesorhabditis belari TaxID=2138241 RepID=A0AAF3FM23_9BILA
MFRFGLAVICFIGGGLAYDGWDGIQAVSADGFKCLANNGYSFFVARVWHSYGGFDETGIQNIKNARAAGWKDVDGYIFPCVRSTCDDAGTQVRNVVNQLNAEGAQFGMLWLDIEIWEWGTDMTWNQNFITALGNELDALKINWGIYTSRNNWQSIVGVDWSVWSSKPLWWATYDGKKDYSDFKAFGGWNKVAIHQWAGSVNGPCGVNMDLNYYP